MERKSKRPHGGNHDDAALLCDYRHPWRFYVRIYDVCSADAADNLV